MSSPISTVTSMLLSTVIDNSKSSSYLRREILNRALVLTTIFFQIIDTVANIGLVILKVSGRALKVCGLRIIPANLVSSEAISANIKEAKLALFSRFTLGFKLFKKIKYLGDQSKSSSEHINRKALAWQELNTLSAEDLNKNWNLNKYFGHIYVINLDDKPGEDSNKKRLISVTEELNKVGCRTFERLRATYGPDELSSDVHKRIVDNSFGKSGEELDRIHRRQAGCFHSHFRVIQDAHNKHQDGLEKLKRAQEELKSAKNEDQRADAQLAIKAAEKQIEEYKCILITEDDNGFGFLEGSQKNKTVSMEGTGTLFREAMLELPEDWGMFYFLTVDCQVDGSGWMSTSPLKYSDNLNKLRYGLLGNAIAINSTAYASVLAQLIKIEQPGKQYRPVDHEYAYLHSRDVPAYVPRKPLAFQGAGASSITNGEGTRWDGSWERGY